MPDGQFPLSSQTDGDGKQFSLMDALRQDPRFQALSSVFGYKMPSLPESRGSAYELGGKVTDWTGSPTLGTLANLAAMNFEGPPGQAATVFHGSPHSFDKFLMEKVGTGEGAQAYGHGLYFAENPSVAKSYAQNVKNAMISYNDPRFGGKHAVMSGNEVISTHTSSDAAQKALAKVAAERQNLYKVDLPDEAIGKMLDWDKGLSQQPQIVQDAVKKIYPKEYANMLKQEALDREIKDMANAYKQPGNLSYIESIRNAPVDVQKAWHAKVQQYKDLTQNYQFALPSTGEAIHRNLEQKLGANENVMKFLTDHGIPGIKYLDQGSRSAGKGTYNYVVFDENLPKIVGRE